MGIGSPLYLGARRVPHLLRSAGIIHQAPHLDGEILGVARLKQQSGLAVTNQLGQRT
jgi:hypothetical protein